MDSGSFGFILYGLVAATISNLRDSARWRSIVLAAATIGFLSLLGGRAVEYVPLASFEALGFGAVMCVERRRRTWVLSATLATVVLLFAWLKRYSFLPHAIFLSSPYQLIGLSYIFFRILHLIIEAGVNDDYDRIKPFRYLLYTLNFTTFVSGPIQLYRDFARDQFAETPPPLDVHIVGSQIDRIVRGFFKVNVVAMVLYASQQDALVQISQTGETSTRLALAIWLGVVYPFFLYNNFSGYIDIVIAVARLMRLRLPENFDRPFSAASFLDFWNRWHITLSTWLKTYVYNPLLLASMRRTSSQTLRTIFGVACFFVTFFLIGIWHGRTSEFVLFGTLQGGGVAVNKSWQLMMSRRMGRRRYAALCAQPLYVAAARGLTFAWFAFTLQWFWADWHQIGVLFGTLTAAQWMIVWVCVWCVATISLAAWEGLRAHLFAIRIGNDLLIHNRYLRVIYASALATIGILLTILLNQAAPGIVYKAF